MLGDGWYEEYYRDYPDPELSSLPESFQKRKRPMTMSMSSPPPPPQPRHVSLGPKVSHIYENPGRRDEAPGWVKNTRTLEGLGAPPPWARAHGRRRRMGRRVTPRRKIFRTRRRRPVGPPPAARIDSKIKSALQGAAANVVTQVCAEMRKHIRVASNTAMKQYSMGVGPRRAIKAGARAAFRLAMRKTNIPTSGIPKLPNVGVKF